MKKYRNPFNHSTKARARNFVSALTTLGLIVSGSGISQAQTTSNVAANSGISNVVTQAPIGKIDYPPIRASAAIEMTLKAPEMVPTGTCSKPFTITFVNKSGKPAKTGSAFTLDILGRGNDQLFADASCTTPVSNLSIPRGATTAKFFIKASGGEYHLLKAKVVANKFGGIPLGTESDNGRYRSCTPSIWRSFEKRSLHQTGLGLREAPVMGVYGYSRIVPEVESYALPTCPYATGDIRIPVLMVDWADYNPATDISNPENPSSYWPYQQTYARRTKAELEAMLNGPNGIGKYFRDVSGGAMRVVFDVYDWLSSDAPNSYLKNRSEYIKAYPDGVNYRCEVNEVFMDALRDAVLSRGLDLSHYDSDANGVLDGAVLLYEGHPGKCSGTNMSWTNGTAYPGNPTAFFLDQLTTGISASDPNYARLAQQSTFVNHYNNMPEDTMDLSNEARSLRTWAHELGHLFYGFPDYYYNQNAMGAFGMSASAPIISHFAAWEKSIFGLYFDPQEVSTNGTYSIKANEIADGGNYQSGSYLLKIGIDGDPRRYITIENRCFQEDGNTKSTWAQGLGRESGIQIVEFDFGSSVFSVDKPQVRRQLPARATSYEGLFEASFRPGDVFQKCYSTQCIKITPVDGAGENVRVAVEITKK